MTTKRKDNSNTKNDVRSTNPPAIYKIEYPNSRTGMFSLRPPFKDFYINENPQQIYNLNLTPNVIHPKYLHMDQNQQERPFYQRSLQQDAQVQCSLKDSDSRDGLFVRRRRPFVTDSYDDGHLSPRYRVQLKLQPAQPNVYEVWNAEPPPRSIPIREPYIRVHSPHLVNVKSLSDDEYDYDDYFVRPHYLRRTYFPPNVRMVRVRQDASTICY